MCDADNQEQRKKLEHLLSVSRGECCLSGAANSSSSKNDNSTTFPSVRSIVTSSSSNEHQRSFRVRFAEETERLEVRTDCQFILQSQSSCILQCIDSSYHSNSSARSSASERRSALKSPKYKVCPEKMKELINLEVTAMSTHLDISEDSDIEDEASGQHDGSKSPSSYHERARPDPPGFDHNDIVYSEINAPHDDRFANDAGPFIVYNDVCDDISAISLNGSVVSNHSNKFNVIVPFQEQDEELEANDVDFDSNDGEETIDEESEANDIRSQSDDDSSINAFRFDSDEEDDTTVEESEANGSNSSGSDDDRDEEDDTTDEESKANGSNPSSSDDEEEFICTSVNNMNDFDSKGRCVRHPHVWLRKKRLFGYGWNVLMSACPDCCVDELRRLHAKEKSIHFSIPTKKTTMPRISNKAKYSDETASLSLSTNSIGTGISKISAVTNSSQRGYCVNDMAWEDIKGRRGAYTGEVDQQFIPNGKGSMLYEDSEVKEGEWEDGVCTHVQTVWYCFWQTPGTNQ